MVENAHFNSLEKEHKGDIGVIVRNGTISLQ